MTPLVRTRQANQDIDQALQYYWEEAGAHVMSDLLDELDKAQTHISHFPGTGSPKYAKLMPKAKIRFWSLDRFPYAIFYTETKTQIVVIRVLHQASDIPQHLKIKTS